MLQLYRIRTISFLFCMLFSSVAFCCPQEEQEKDLVENSAIPMEVPAAEDEDSQGDASAEDEALEEEELQTLEPTHKQIRKIEITHEGESIELHTFCLSPKGNILASCGGDTQTYEETDNGYETVTITQAKLIQVLNPEGELLNSIPVDFTPTAITTDASGNIYVAGKGNVAKLDSAGKLINQANTPNIGNLEELKQTLIEEAQKEAEENRKELQERIEKLNKRIVDIEKTPEEERTRRQKRRQLAATKRIEKYETMLDDAFDPQEVDVEQLIGQRLDVSSISVTDQFIFYSCSAEQGYGFDIWRSDLAFENGVRVLESISGCCGQMDVKATNDALLVAENTKYRVGVYDHDGKKVFNFGKSDRRDRGAGFGSCCNPMNVCGTLSGDILTAESGVGAIKRFGADGEFKGLVGKAKVGGGCKNVTIAVDEQRDYYFMLSKYENSICVLVPMAEAPEFSEDEADEKTEEVDADSKTKLENQE